MESPDLPGGWSLGCGRPERDICVFPAGWVGWLARAATSSSLCAAANSIPALRYHHYASACVQAAAWCMCGGAGVVLRGSWHCAWAGLLWVARVLADVSPKQRGTPFVHLVASPFLQNTADLVPAFSLFAGTPTPTPTTYKPRSRNF
jgi:hypothetical protein